MKDFDQHSTLMMNDFPLSVLVHNIFLQNYVHRSGRTARASKEGISVMLIEPAENFAYKKLSRTLGRSEDEMPTFPVDADIFPQVKQRVKVLHLLLSFSLVIAGICAGCS